MNEMEVKHRGLDMIDEVEVGVSSVDEVSAAPVDEGRLLDGNTSG